MQGGQGRREVRGVGDGRVRRPEGRMTGQDVERFRVLLERLESSLAADRAGQAVPAARAVVLNGAAVPDA